MRPVRASTRAYLPARARPSTRSPSRPSRPRATSPRSPASAFARPAPSPPRKTKVNVAVMACVASSVRVVARVPRVAAARGRGSVSPSEPTSSIFTRRSHTRAATVRVRAKEELQKREMADADASIEPCLVGWSAWTRTAWKCTAASSPAGRCSARPSRRTRNTRSASSRSRTTDPSTSAATRGDSKCGGVRTNTDARESRWRSRRRSCVRPGQHYPREKYRLVSSPTPRDSTHIRHHARLCFARRSYASITLSGVCCFKRIHASGVASRRLSRHSPRRRRRRRARPGTGRSLDVNLVLGARRRAFDPSLPMFFSASAMAIPPFIAMPARPPPPPPPPPPRPFPSRPPVRRRPRLRTPPSPPPFAAADGSPSAPPAPGPPSRRR